MTRWAWSYKGRAYALGVARSLWTSFNRWAERVQRPRHPIANGNPAKVAARFRVRARKVVRAARSATRHRIKRSRFRARARRVVRSTRSAVRRGIKRAKWPTFTSPSATLLIVAAVALATYSIAFDALPPESSIDRLVLDKSERRLIAFCQGKTFKTYTVALGRAPVGAKRFDGDGKTPEGVYMIDWRKVESDYHLALHVSYPRSTDLAYAKRHRKSPGGSIMIHGTPDGYGYQDSQQGTYDWTDGCIAVTNDEIEELWHIVPDGTPIEIRP